MVVTRVFYKISLFLQLKSNKSQSRTRFLKYEKSLTKAGVESCPKERSLSNFANLQKTFLKKLFWNFYKVLRMFNAPLGMLNSHEMVDSLHCYRLQFLLHMPQYLFLLLFSFFCQSQLILLRISLL